MKKRADILITEKFNNISRNKAKALIMSGDVYLKEVRINKAGELIDDNEIEFLMVNEKDKYVSRGAYKLIGAINKWNLDFNNLICMDVGASTGGFTHVMLTNNAKKIYSIDVGYGQLDYSIRTNEKVVVLEKENIRYLEKEKICDGIDFMTMDISFISIKKVLEHTFTFLKKDAMAIILVKPQFESLKSKKTKGVIKDKKVHKEVLLDIIEYFRSINKKIIDIYFSPIKGPKGNREFLLYASNSNWEDININIDDIIDKSHKEI